MRELSFHTYSSFTLPSELVYPTYCNKVTHEAEDHAWDLAQIGPRSLIRQTQHATNARDSLDGSW